MGSYNKKSIARKVVRSKAFAKGAEKKIINNLARAKRIALNEFDNHPVTQEISRGSGGANLTQTLGGYGNLFSFIGFDEGDDPIRRVRNLLIQIPKIRSKKLGRNGINFTISTPTVKDFGAVARMPWEAGRSWVEGIEAGISGFSYYMANLFGKSVDKSRSGGAIQSKYEIRTSAYRPTPYMSEILKKFDMIILGGI